MARLPRIILPNCPHHVTQRGNRRQQTFFSNEDYLTYLNDLEELSIRHKVDVIAYCLMPNHVHLIVVPPSREALIFMISNLHERYSRYINFKNQWRGHLWQGRFFSVPLSDSHLHRCLAYVESNPIRSSLIPSIDEYKWVSRNYKQSGIVFSESEFSDIKTATRTGRPIGPESFLNKVKKLTGIDPIKKRRGPKPSPKKI